MKKHQTPAARAKNKDILRKFNHQKFLFLSPKNLPSCTSHIGVFGNSKMNAKWLLLVTLFTFSAGFSILQTITPPVVPGASLTSVKGLTMTVNGEYIVQVAPMDNGTLSMVIVVERRNSSGLWEFDSMIFTELSVPTDIGIFRFGSCISSDALTVAASCEDTAGYVVIYKRPSLVAPWARAQLLGDPNNATFADRIFGEDIICTQPMDRIVVAAPGTSAILPTLFYIFEYNSTQQLWSLVCTKSGTTNSTISTVRCAMGISLDGTTTALATNGVSRQIEISGYIHVQYS